MANLLMSWYLPTILDKAQKYNQRQERKRIEMFFYEDNTEMSEELPSKYLRCQRSTKNKYC